MAQERKDLEKFLKHLSTRFYQVIVQSRSGKKQKTSSSPPPRSKTAVTHWYWLDIPNDPSTGEGHLDIPPPSVGRPLCVEVAVETSEGDMVLETWVLYLEKPFDDSERMFVVYRGLSNLLRSVIVTSRTMTGYHVARQYQGDLTLKHRFYNGKPKLEGLGKCSNDYKVHKLGSVSTMLGCVIVATAWRKDSNIKLESASSSTLCMTSNYFDASQMRYSAEQREAVATGRRRNSCADPLEMARNIAMPPLPSPPVSVQKLAPQLGPEDQDYVDGGLVEGVGFSPLQTAFADPVGVPVKEDELFKALFTSSCRSTTPTAGRQDSDGLGDSTLEQSPEASEERGFSGQALSQLEISEFEHLEVKTAFDPSDDTEDVGLFYRHLKQLPPTLSVLDKWDDAPTDLTTAIRHFEEKGREFNAFVASLST